LLPHEGVFDAVPAEAVGHVKPSFITKVAFFELTETGAAVARDGIAVIAGFLFVELEKSVTALLAYC